MSPPPALSPPTATCFAAMPWLRRKRHAASASSYAAGKGCSGARRYSTARVRMPAARPASVTIRRWLRAEPEQYPPPWKNISTREASLPGTMDHSPGTPLQSAGESSTSPATGHTEPTSSIRSRRAFQPTGRGLELKRARMASISLFMAISPGPGVEQRILSGSPVKVSTLSVELHFPFLGKEISSLGDR